MCQRVSTAARHFNTIYAIFTQLFLHDFCAILHDFYTILRNFCDFYAIFCQAQIFCCQAPKTILHPCPDPYLAFLSNSVRFNDGDTLVTGALLQAQLPGLLLDLLQVLGMPEIQVLY